MTVICPICGRPTSIKEVKLDEDSRSKDVKEERTPMDFAMKNYARLQKDELRRVVGKKLADIIEQNFEVLRDLAYEMQNKTLRITFADDHTYVIHVYYVLEVFRYVAISPAVLDFLHNKKVKGENDDIKEAILTLLMLANPLYSLLYIMSENQKGREGRENNAVEKE
jgi:hypothetical protein